MVRLRLQPDRRHSVTLDSIRLEGSVNFLFLFPPDMPRSTSTVRRREGKDEGSTHVHFLCAQPCGNVLVNTPAFVVVVLEVEPRAW